MTVAKTACPSCHVPLSKMVCPRCGVVYKRKRGGLYPENLNPPDVLIEQLERHVSNVESAIRGVEVSFNIPRKSNQYKIEVATAWRYLESCDHDLDLARRALDLCLTDKRFAPKRPPLSLTFLSRQWPLAVAVARALRDKEEEERRKALAFFDQIAQRESVWQ